MRPSGAEMAARVNEAKRRDMRLRRQAEATLAALPPIKYRDVEHDAATSTSPGSFRFHRGADRVDDIPVLAFDINGYRVHDTFGTTAGEMKTLKSTVCMAVYVAQAAGVAALGHFQVPAPRPVLYVVGEGGETPFLRRLARIRDGYGLTSPDLDRFVYTVDTAPLTDPGFLAAVLDQLGKLEAETGTTGTLVIDPKYAVHPASVDARNLLDEGAMLRRFTAPIVDAGWSLDIVDHFNQSGTGLNLKRVTMAGAGEWADSWTLLSHRETPDVNAGRFRLEMQVGSRQWGGATWWVDINLGRFDMDTLDHVGDMTWNVAAPAPEDDTGDEDRDAAVALEITQVLRRARQPVTRTDVVERTRGRNVDVRRVLSEMIDDGRVTESEDTRTDRSGRGQKRMILTLHSHLSLVEMDRPRGTS